MRYNWFYFFIYFNELFHSQFCREYIDLESRCSNLFCTEYTEEKLMKYALIKYRKYHECRYFSNIVVDGYQGEKRTQMETCSGRHLEWHFILIFTSQKSKSCSSLQACECIWSPHCESWLTEIRKKESPYFCQSSSLGIGFNICEG